MNSNSKAALTAAALSLTLTLIGCATSGTSLDPIDLPSPAAAGDLLRKVPTPSVKKGDDARLKLAETRAALAKANGRIVGSCDWIDEQRREYNPKTAKFNCDRPPVK